MSQFGMVIANESGAAFRADVNLALAALVGNNSGATEPATKYAFMFWHDTANALLKMRNAANNAWVIVLDLSTTAARFQIAAGSVGSPSLAVAGSLTTGLFSGSANQFSLAANGVEILRILSTYAQFIGTGAMIPPVGTTAQRPGSPVAGMVRFNSDTGLHEGWTGASWVTLGGSPAPSVAIKTAGYTATTAEDLIVVNAASNTTQNLYAANATGRKDLVYQNINSGIASIAAAGSDKIVDPVTGADNTSLDLAPGQTVTLRPDGSSKWYVI